MLVVIACALSGAPMAVLAQATQPPAGPASTAPGGTEDELSMPKVNDMAGTLVDELSTAALRLPVAAALGTALALRPRRRGTPKRYAAVVETQIVLAVVGAVIMLVIGSSLARAFGIVGAANLIRYRSKIDDPKDAVVMLSALSVGLAAGVGLYAISIFSTLFLVAVLWVIEGFEMRRRIFELSVKLGDKTGEYRSRIEAVLRRFRAKYELRATSEEEVTYMVLAPLDMDTNHVTKELAALAPEGQGAVEWKEKVKAELNQRPAMP